MTTKIPFEPFTIWKDLYEHTEKAWHDVIQTTLAKESFSEGLGQVQSSYLQYQEFVNKMAESYFKQANIPTPDEIANVATLVINLEEKIDTIDDQLNAASESTTSEINVLKETVSAVEKKLDTILTKLTALDKQLVTLNAAAKKVNPTPKPTTPRKKTTPKSTATKTSPVSEKTE